MKKGRLIVITGPSGVGKTTLLKRLLKGHKKEITFSVSYTSREPRINEIDGVDYFFITKEEFEKEIKENKFLEYALVHGNFYGTSREQVDKVIKGGKDCLLDIDVQGGLILMSKNTEAMYIFIAPPSLDTLKERLYHRSTDDVEVIERRLKNAEKELLEKDKYDFLVINDNLETAYKDLEKIIY